MASKYGTYSCGCKGYTQVHGTVRNQIWIAKKHFKKMCPDCYKQYLKDKFNIQSS